MRSRIDYQLPLSIYHGRSWPELLVCIELALSLAVKWAYDQSFNGLGSGSTQEVQ